MKILLQSKRMKWIILTVFFLFTSNSIIFADVFRLTSGQIVEGEIIEQSEKVIVIQSSHGIFTVKKSEILETESSTSKEKIVRPPAEKNLTLSKIALLSFIPGYSPMYHSKDHPELGVPFAMLNLAYFYKFLQFQTNSKTVGFLNSVESKQLAGFYGNYLLGPSIVSGQLLPGASEAIKDANYTTSYFVYVNLRAAIYNGHRDRIVNGELMSEDEYLKIKKRNLSNYFVTSIANAAFSYIMLRREGSMGAFYKTEFNGIKTAFYAFPTNDGGIFGTVSRF